MDMDKRLENIEKAMFDMVNIFTGCMNECVLDCSTQPCNYADCPLTTLRNFQKQYCINLKERASQCEEH